MNSEARKAKLNELKANKNNIAMTGIPLRYRSSTLFVDVYKIPLEFLIYNKYNGRIGSEVKSFEKQYYELNPEIKEDRRKIEGFLFDSKRERNKTTLDSLRIKTQQRYGIVTADGVIIDGNRRAMLLNKLFHERDDLGYAFSEVEHCQYFLAIILPEDASKKDIHQLETTYQMGEDDKLDYDAIEKYLKCKELYEYFETDAIAGFMGENEGQIMKWLSILSLMEDYLDEYGYTGIYTRLEKTEGPFVDLNSYLESYDKRGRNTSEVEWEYSDLDITELKLICFDYIRARYEGKEFRDIAKTGKGGSIFFHKDLWDEFLREHKERVPPDEETVEELRGKYPNEDLSKLLKRRDEEWKTKAKGQLEGNLRRYTSKLEDKRVADKPSELIEKALSALRAVDYQQSSFLTDPHIKEMVKDINSIVWDMKKLLDRK